MVDATTQETIHNLPRLPVHLFQLNKDPGAYYNEKGCGAFTTAMALSFYQPARFGNYDAARKIFDRMLKVPFFGGTFESQNAVIGQRHGFFARNYDHGTPAELAAAIDCGAPTIMLVRPGFLGIGQHDVLLVGYSVDSSGRLLNFFVDNPEIESDKLQLPPRPEYPGNEVYSVPFLSTWWTGCFTPFLGSPAAVARWRELTHRD
ncbi:MAG: hypothetical protein M3328_14280 [Chloroflexota bacterium]|nr:hypothetical protein [Chloroflexota bacterium]